MNWLPNSCLQKVTVAKPWRVLPVFCLMAPLLVGGAGADTLAADCKTCAGLAHTVSAPPQIGISVVPSPVVPPSAKIAKQAAPRRPSYFPSVLVPQPVTGTLASEQKPVPSPVVPVNAEQLVAEQSVEEAASVSLSEEEGTAGQIRLMGLSDPEGVSADQAASPKPLLSEKGPLTSSPHANNQDDAATSNRVVSLEQHLASEEWDAIDAAMVDESLRTIFDTTVPSAHLIQDGVDLALATDLPPPPPPNHPASSATVPLVPPSPEPLSVYESIDTPFVEYDYAPQPIAAEEDCDICKWFGPLGKYFFYSQLVSADAGIGHERVAFAPFSIEQAQPMRNIRTRVDSSFGLTSPDRAEYFWAASGTGPAIPNGDINYFDFRYITETGGDKFSMTTDIPIRTLHYSPDVSTGGLGNISLATKTAIVAGQDWYISQIMRFYLPFGSKSHGTSNGHFSLEPGLLARYRYNDRLYFHSQFKWWIPFGGNSSVHGQVLNYGMGVSTILYESDGFALLPTLEFDGWAIMSGKKTLPDGTLVSAGGDAFVNVSPGVRYVFGPTGELGLFEFGIMGGFKFGGEGWYDNSIRLELRWTY